MPFSRPSPFEIRDRLAAEIGAALPGADARLRRSVEEVLVRMIALASHEMHGHLGWIADQQLPDTADDDVLARHAAIWGIPRIAAKAAQGSVSVTGSAGAVLPAGTELRRADDARYLVDADATLDISGAATAAVTAVVAGAAGDAVAGVTLNLVAPVPGVTGTVTVAAGGIGPGADVETDTRLRARLLQRIQNPPAGGAAHDYEAWALAVAGVERVWIAPLHAGAGTVGIIILASGGALPGAPLIADVQAAIDAERPVTALATVYAPATQTVDLTIDLSTDSTAIRAAVLAELADFFRREAQPGGTLRLSRLSAAISAAAGEVSHLLTAPGADVALPAGTIAVLGTVTWS